MLLKRFSVSSVVLLQLWMLLCSQASDSAAQSGGRSSDRPSELSRGSDLIPPKSSLPTRQSARSQAVPMIVGKTKSATTLAMQPVYQTSGREFYLVFPSLVGNDLASQGKRSIYISARSRSIVTLSVINRGWSQTYVTKPHQLLRVDLPDWIALDRGQIEAKCEQMLHVESEDVVSIYGYAHNSLSTDGFLALPRESLGTHYVVASLRNALNYLQFMYSGVSVPRSEFAFGAIEDNTTITFTLTADSYSGVYRRGVPYTITLDRGQVFQIAARDTGDVRFFDSGDPQWSGYYYNRAFPGSDCDLTGSQIIADKPFVAFSGHERASAPDDLEFDLLRIFASPTASLVSRDHIVEQLPPVETWGRKFIIVSSADVGRPTNGDYVRVIPAYDNTVVSLNGTPVARVNAGEFYQFFAGPCSYLETDKSAMVVKYMQTALEDVTAMGDPTMTVVQPVENMSTYYTMPNVVENNFFLEHYLMLVVPSEAIATTLVNGRDVSDITFADVPGTTYKWGIKRVAAGEQRVECSLPCYAETYGFGRLDSYAFPGGGGYKYVDSLFAYDLDFKVIQTNTEKQLVSGVYSAQVQSDLADTIEVYRLTWEDGDTSVFELTDNINYPIYLAPGAGVSLPFKFRPPIESKFNARMRVWSNSHNEVFINVVGQSADPIIEVEPPVIDFGRVRVGKQRKESLSVQNKSPLIDLRIDTRTKLADSLVGTSFTVPAIANVTIPPSGAVLREVQFAPTIVGYQSATLQFFSNDPRRSDTATAPRVRLFGRGIRPDLSSSGHDFGKVRVKKRSAEAFVTINNLGSDTTLVDAVEIVEGDLNDFTLDAAMLPSSSAMLRLDTAGDTRSSKGFRVWFTPSSVGKKMAVVRFHSLEADQTRFDTLRGEGVEPYINANPRFIDFGKFNASKTSDIPQERTITFQVENTGTMEGILDSLTRLNPFNVFRLRFPNGASSVKGDILLENNKIDVEATFVANLAGRFYDTLRFWNDSPNQPVGNDPGSKPIVILTAQVVAGAGDVTPYVYLDTVRDCQPIETEIVLHNPHRDVTISFDTLYLSGDTAGFSIGGLQFNFPIYISPDSTFRVPVRYVFPKDSLNGEQCVTLNFVQPTGSDDPPITISSTICLTRKIKILTLTTKAPSFTPSAGDAYPFKLPITIVGERTGVTELENFTLALRFENELMKPVGVDRAGSLTEVKGAYNPQISSYWDEASRVFTIRAEGVPAHRPEFAANNLLLTVLVRTFLTLDTVTSVVPELNLDSRPCAYAVEKTGTGLLYAEDCGDITIRPLLDHKLPSLRVLAAMPNPSVSPGEPIKLRCASGVGTSDVSAEIVAVNGTVEEKIGIPGINPAGTFTLQLQPSGRLSNGAKIIRITARDPATGEVFTTSTRIWIAQ